MGVQILVDGLRRLLCHLAGSDGADDVEGGISHHLGQSVDTGVRGQVGQSPVKVELQRLSPQPPRSGVRFVGLSGQLAKMKKIILHAIN